MKKIFILSIVSLSFAVMSGYALAHHALAQDVAAVSATEQITVQDLGVEDPGMLPTSRFYFFKNWGRAIERVLTRDPIKRADLELEITNQQAAEIEKIKEVSPERTDVIAKAAENYQSNVDRLKTRLEALQETSQNPNVDKLLEKLTDRSVKHQQLFDELKQKFSDNPELKQRFEAMGDKMNELLAKVPEKFDNPDAFKERIRRTMEARPEGAFKELRGMEIIDRIGEKLPEAHRAQLENVKDEFLNKFEERINRMPEDQKQAMLKPEMLERLSGDPERRIKIMEEMGGRMNLPAELEQKFEAAKEQMMTRSIEKGEIGQAQAEEQIKRAEKAIEDLNTAVNGSNASSVDIGGMQNALTQAKNHLAKAKESFAAGKYGEAFGQAMSAFSAARNGARVPFHRPVLIPGQVPGATLPQTVTQPRTAIPQILPPGVLVPKIIAPIVPPPGATTGTQSPLPIGKCGDGICDLIEKEKGLCAIDCR
jgi:hypothetical protein